MLMILWANMLISAHAVLRIQADDGGGSTFPPLLDNEDARLIWLAAIGLYELSFTLDFGEDNVRRRPYVASGHTDFVARSKGLRAPPAC